MESAIDYCTREVRQHDYDRYLWALCVPVSSRPAQMALLAFNLEISRLVETVSEEMIGLIRLAWWREALDEIYAGGKVREHAVVEALADAVKAHGLSRHYFDAMLEGRERDLSETPIIDEAALITYARQTSSALLHLMLEAAGERGEAAYAAAEEYGIAWALLGLLRAVPYHAAHNRLFIPQDIAEPIAVDISNIGNDKDALMVAIKRIMLLIQQHFASAQKESYSTTGDILLLRVVNISLAHYLGRFAGVGHNPFALIPKRGRFFLQLRVLIAVLCCGAG